MPPQPEPPFDERAVERLLDRALARLRLRDALYAVGAGLCAGAFAVVLWRSAGARVVTIALASAVAAVVTAAGIFITSRHRRTRRAAAAGVESAHPHLQNVLVTAEELLATNAAIPPYMRSRVFKSAARATANLSFERSVALRRSVMWLCAALTALLVAMRVPLPFPAARRASAPTGGVQASTHGEMRRGDFAIEIRPPAYAGLPATRLVNPQALDVLEGSRAVMTLANDSMPRVRLNGEALRVEKRDGGFAAEATLTASGYLAVDPSGREQGSRLIPLTVRADRTPDVRIASPAKDLRVDSSAHTIPIEAAAIDDLGLAMLEIRYTRISGAGEQFEFQEGTLPVATTRTDAKAWQARAQLALSALKMEPGDALVYRAVARDRRPGDAGLSSSDTYFVEITGPGEIALAGFEMPPDRERYVLSQAMIVLKIERLIARERAMAREAVQEAAAGIAAEQRSVRANFIFLLGGEVEDEEQEAETATDIAEGRFENSARREITHATRLMARVEQALTAASTRSALPPAREAAQALQRAFGRNRYLLRALPDRGRIDPSRRLSADVSGASDWRRDLVPPDPDPAVAAARDVLRAQFDAVRALERRADAETVAGALAPLAERVLMIAPADAATARAARDVSAAREAVLRGDFDGARTALVRAIPPVLAVAQRGRIDAGIRLSDRVAGALALEGGR